MAEPSSSSLCSLNASLGNIQQLVRSRQLEQDVETVVKVLQPGPLGIIEHKFTSEEINKAKSTVNRAVENWRRNAYAERNSPFLRDFIGHDRM